MSHHNAEQRDMTIKRLILINQKRALGLPLPLIIVPHYHSLQTHAPIIRLN